MPDFMSQWDEKVGLFLISPYRKAHTKSCRGRTDVHPIPDNLARMVIAAQKGKLSSLDSVRILDNVKKCQRPNRDSLAKQWPRGYIKWNLEDVEVEDQHSPFFSCTSLIPLRKYYAEQLGEEALRLIDDICSECFHFLKFKEDAQISAYYLNSILGKTIIAYLLSEMYSNADETAILIEKLNEIGDYSINEHFGWGEHLSDTYSRVSITVISMLLLMTENLPEKTFKLYKEILRQLIQIEDSFGPDKARVPSIRSYWLVRSRTAYTSYRNSVRAWREDEEVRISNMAPLGPLFNKLNWHQKIAPPISAPKEEFNVQCFNNTLANVINKDDFRIGGFNKYPFIDNCAYLHGYTVPLQFIYKQKDMGFLQWVSEEDGDIYGHPCNVNMKNYYINSAETGLTAKIYPCFGGQTYAVRNGNSFLVLRHMPIISRDWTRLADHLRVMEPTAEFEDKISNRQIDEFTYFSTLSLKWDNGRTLSVAKVNLCRYTTHKKAVLSKIEKTGEKILDWDLEYTDFSKLERSSIVSLWAFSLDKEIVETPLIKQPVLKKIPGLYEFDLKWKIGKENWHAKLEKDRGITVYPDP